LAESCGFVALRDNRKRKTEVMRKQRRIVVETNRVQRVANHSDVYTTHCAGCRNKVELVTFQEAAKITGSPIEKIVRRAAKGELHLGLVPEAMLVCLNSLMNIPNISHKLQTH
jgi:DNA polymerase III alpha subunit (gram-positive type)